MSRLRVAVDGRMLQGSPLGGVGRYLAGVMPELSRQAEVFVLVDGRRPRLGITLPANVEEVALSAPPRVPGLGWLEVAVAPWLRRFGGIFHASFNTLPMSFRGPAVLTLHDLAPQLHAEDFRPLTRAAWRVYIRSSVARASAITTVSEFSRGQIAGYFGVSPARIQVAPDAVDPMFSPERAPAAPALARSLGIPEPYVVAVGGARRRALPVAIGAWRETCRRLGQTIGLAVLGERDLGPEPGLVALGRVDDETWATLLAGATALCYPTRYEGFGLPALEALASGTPVVCSPVASLPEVLGDAACWAREPSAPALAAQLVRLFEDPRWAGERRAAGLARARSAATWSQSAAVLLEAYERAAA
jgi:glycosyltransferase involved in cell wall biosynthesis